MSFVSSGNGYIPTSSLREILMALDDQLTPDQLDEMIGEIDTDGSGTVDFEGESVLRCASVSIFIVRTVKLLTTAAKLTFRVTEQKAAECSSITFIHPSIHTLLSLSYEQVHSLFQSHFSTQCDIVLPLSIFQYPQVSLRSSNSCLLLLTRLPVTYIILYFFPSILCFKGADGGAVG
jgi:hypothetical protein